jgi:hypothetical protein
MLPYRDSRLTRIALIAFFIIVLGYAYYEGRGILFGPTIEVPSEIQQSSEPYVRIVGKAERIASLSMNGNEISVTESGQFDEPYLLAPGLNRVTLDATDKYGRSRQSVIQIVYTPADMPAPAAELIATSTATTTVQ